MFKTITLFILSVYYATVNCNATTEDHIMKRRSSQTLICYDCINCNTVTVNTATADCPSPGRCYQAIASEDDDFELSGVRGCITTSNEDVCGVIETQYLRQYDTEMVKSIFKQCKTCNSTSCNGDPFEINGASPVTCYKCKECDRVNSNTSSIICPEDRCCYRASFADSSDGKMYSVRGCKRLKKGETCKDTCLYVQKLHQEQYPDGHKHVCINCDKDDSNNCNYFQFNLPRDASEKKDIMCYNCTDCPLVTTLTPNSVCPDSECCYSASLKKPFGVTVIRGCWTPPEGRTCKHTCTDMKGVELCSMCAANDLNECNAMVFDKSPKLIGCYSCRNCNQVAKSTRMIMCDLECCIRALVTNSAVGDWSTIRDCIQTKDCEKAYSIVGQQHQSKHPNGKVHVCIKCKKSETDKCNEESFTGKDLEMVTLQLKCYQCVDCHEVNEKTPVVDCMNGRCCYSSYMKNKPTGEYYVTRGCGKIEHKPCPNTCRDQKNRHLMNHPNGEFVKCLPCSNGDKCNSFSYYNDPKIPTPPKHKSIFCYECTDCYTASSNIRTVTCHASCCYVAAMKNHYTDSMHVNRGCKHEEDCTQTCIRVKDDHLWTKPYGVFIECKTCEENATDKCNTQTIEEPITTTLPPDTDYIMCYDCQDCNKVATSTNTTRCDLPGYCYIIIVKKSSTPEKFAVRGCASGDNDATCQNITDTYLENNPETTVHYCYTCSDHKEVCNENTYTIEDITQQHSCYNCTNCNCVSEDTPIVNCSQPNCCYMALVQNKVNENMFAIRGCKKSQARCDDTCNLVAYSHKYYHPGGTINFCMTCQVSDTTDVCNNNAYTP